MLLVLVTLSTFHKKHCFQFCSSQINLVLFFAKLKSILWRIYLTPIHIGVQFGLKIQSNATAFDWIAVQQGRI